MRSMWHTRAQRQDFSVRTLSFARAVARPLAWSRRAWERLGDARLRVRTRGAAHRPRMVLDLHDQIQQARVSCFFKQWGGVHKHKTGRAVEGRTWDEMPE
jgi:hypothetical protein